MTFPVDTLTLLEELNSLLFQTQRNEGFKVAKPLTFSLCENCVNIRLAMCLLSNNELTYPTADEEKNEISAHG